jgi:hypothetical protein
MNPAGAFHPAEPGDRRRLLLALAGAVLIASAGFTAIMFLVAWIPSLLVARDGSLAPTVSAALDRLPGTRVFQVLPSLMPIIVMIPTIAVIIRKKHSNQGSRSSLKTRSHRF